MWLHRLREVTFGFKLKSMPFMYNPDRSASKNIQFENILWKFLAIKQLSRKVQTSGTHLLML